MKCNLWVVILLILVFGSFLPSFAADIDPTMRHEDRRLERPVTVAERRICLGNLLDRISKQTGTPITINAQTPASGIMVEVYCQQIPAAVLLNALSSAFSSRDAAWTWIRGGNPGFFYYKLAPTPGSQQRSERLRRYAWKALDDYAHLMIELAHMSPQEYERNKHRLTTFLGLTDDQWADALSHSSLFTDIRLFSEAVPEADQPAVLAGQNEAWISVKDLPLSTQQLAHEVWKSYHIVQNGVLAPEPDTLHYYTRSMMTNQPSVVPSVWFDLGAGNGSMSFLGGRDVADMVRAAIKRAWMLPGDAADNPAALRHVNPVPDPPRSGSDIQLVSGRAISFPFERAVDLRLSQIAQGASLPLVAVMPARQGNDPCTPVGDTVQGFFAKQKFHELHLMYKWRGDVLIVSYPEWFQEDYETTTVSLALVKQYLRAKDGMVSLANIMGLFSVLTESQVVSLEPDYSVVGSLALLYPLRTLYNASPAVATADGLALDAALSASLLNLPMFQTCTPLRDKTATAVRIFQQDDKAQGETQRIIQVAVFDARSQKWVSVFSMAQKPPQADAPTKKIGPR